MPSLTEQALATSLRRPSALSLHLPSAFFRARRWLKEPASTPRLQIREPSTERAEAALRHKQKSLRRRGDRASAIGRPPAPPRAAREAALHCLHLIHDLGANGSSSRSPRPPLRRAPALLHLLDCQRDGDRRRGSAGSDLDARRRRRCGRSSSPSRHAGPASIQPPGRRLNRQTDVVGAATRRKCRDMTPRLRVITGGGRTPAPPRRRRPKQVVLCGGLDRALLRRRVLPRPWKPDGGQAA